MADPIANPFVGLSPDMHGVIEKLIARVWNDCDEWFDEDEDLLTQWREAREDDGLDAWSWWVGEVGAESYSFDAGSRKAAIEIGNREYAEQGRFEIIEARTWADIVKEGEDISTFARTRNREIVEVGNG
jgi:hypothetical protein